LIAKAGSKKKVTRKKAPVKKAAASPPSRKPATKNKSNGSAGRVKLPTDNNLLTQAQYARHRDVTQPTVSLWISAGKLDAALEIHKGFNQGRPLINKKKADELMDLNGPLRDAKTKNATLDASLKELKLKQASGDLLDRATVEAEAFECARVTRDRLLQISDRLAPLVAAELDVKVCRQMIHKEVITALESLSA